VTGGFSEADQERIAVSATGATSKQRSGIGFHVACEPPNEPRPRERSRSRSRDRNREIHNRDRRRSRSRERESHGAMGSERERPFLPRDERQARDRVQQDAARIDADVRRRLALSASTSATAAPGMLANGGTVRALADEQRRERLLALIRDAEVCALAESHTQRLCSRPRDREQPVCRASPHPLFVHLLH
jgi:hypothetical protein